MTDPEVARYALRTFRAEETTRDWKIAFRPIASALVRWGPFWENGTCTARCLGNEIRWNRGRDGYLPIRPPAHEAPAEGCMCGIYGALSLANLKYQYPRHADRLVAVIAAEGATIIGSIGLRTQFARVVAFWTPHDNIAEAATEQFLGAQQFADVEGMLDVYGLPVSNGSLWTTDSGGWKQGEKRIERNG